MEAACEEPRSEGENALEAIALVEKLGNPTHVLDGKKECREAKLAFAFKSATYEAVDRLIADDPGPL